MGEGGGAKTVRAREILTGKNTHLSLNLTPSLPFFLLIISVPLPSAPSNLATHFWQWSSQTRTPTLTSWGGVEGTQNSCLNF